VIFYGAGRVGYAAGGYLLRPPAHGLLPFNRQATLDPSVGEWDDRFFIEMRRTDFTIPFPAMRPKMQNAAEAAYGLL